MGLFDLFKKKKPTQSLPVIKQEISHPHVTECVTHAPASTKKVVSLAGTSAEQDTPPTLASLLKSSTPSKQGLYPHEIIMLEYAPRFKTTNNTFQSFWYWQYSVTEPQAILDSLFERGFTEVGDLRSALDKLKLPEIKEELKQLNQKVTGKKVELIDRLIEFGDLGALNKKYSERYYVLSPKGEQELKENRYVTYLHRNRYMSVWEMNQRIAQTHYDFRDILWGYFNELAGVHFQNFDFGLYRNIRLDMYQFLMEENKPKTAFHMLCEVLSYDLSGLGNGERVLFESEMNDPKSYLMIYGSRVEQFFPYENTSLIIPGRVAIWFAEMQATLGMEDKDYRDAILKELREISPPHRIFTDEECADIIMADIHNETDTLSAIYDKAEKREKTMLQRIEASLVRQ